MSFREAAITFIKARAAQAAKAQARDFEIVSLAAHLFAIGCQLQLNHGSSRLFTREREQFAPAWGSEEELFRELGELAPDLDNFELFSAIISALLTIENLLHEEPSYRGALGRPTRLEGFPEGPFRGLGGRVFHWMRPLSALGQERDARFREAEGGPPDPAPDPAIYLERLALYWDSDPRLPAVVPVTSSDPTDALFARSGKDFREERIFRVALCPLPGRFHPRFHIKEGRHFHALQKDSIFRRDEMHDHLSAVVNAAFDKEVNLLVFPELSVDSPALAHLQSLRESGLRQGKRSLYGIVAGSFHFWGKPGADAPLAVNEAILLDLAGEIRASHWKKGRFRVTPAQVKFVPDLYDKVPEKMAREIFEEIHYGSELRVLDTSLGRMVVLICADAIAADDLGYMPVVRRLRPDLLIVVSMTPETTPFEAFAEEMRSYRIGTLFVNAHCVCVWPEGRERKDPLPNLVSCDLALYEPAKHPPTRLRWRYGQTDGECIYFRPDDNNRDWRSVSGEKRETGVSWLTRGDERLGMVVNLGVHARGKNR